MPRKYKIAFLPGDGIGREVIPEALKVLRAVEELSNLNFEFIPVEGGATYWLKTGRREEWPPEAYSICKDSDAILFGAVGIPGVNYPDGTSVGNRVIFSLRFGLDLYANVRPVKLYDGVPCPLIGKKPKDIDFVIVRENTEDLYIPIRGFLERGETRELAIDVRVVTRRGSERVIKYAFELCRRRNGAPIDGRRRVTCIDKSNVLRGCLFFRQIFDEVAGKYSDVDKDYAYVDAFTQWIITRPERYDVCVTTNMFGDIVTDLTSVLQGGMGMAPSGEIGDGKAMFEPIHGTAPDIAGKGIANPIATILSAKMMLEWLGDKYEDESARKAALRIEEAVKRVLADGRVRTPDLGGSSRTSEVGDAIASIVKQVD
ncbi:MAG: isocitrate/isopropylmalate dehydrogenase family protein [Candidatus Methanomethylicia archaeon]